MIVPEPYPTDIFSHAIEKGRRRSVHADSLDWQPSLFPMRVYNMPPSVSSLADLKKRWSRSWDCLLHNEDKYLLVSMKGRNGQHHGWTWDVAAQNDDPKSVMVRRIQEIVRIESQVGTPSHIRHMFMPWYWLDVLWVTNGVSDRFWVFKRKFKRDRGPNQMDVEMSASEFLSFMAVMAEEQRLAHRHMTPQRESLRTKFWSWRHRVVELWRSYV